MLRGYEFQKGQFVLFTPEELKSLEESSRQTIDIVSFIPERSVDPIYFDKPYFLAPDKRGAKPYSLLVRAMQHTGRCALAKWTWRSKEYVVQVRAAEGGLVLQQLLYADEVRSIRALEIELVPVSDAELALAKQIVEQISAETYDPAAFIDEEKQRILAAVERKVQGKEIITHDQAAETTAEGGAVVDLMAALRATTRLHRVVDDQPGAPSRPPRSRSQSDRLDRRRVRRHTSRRRRHR
ncbi:MAG: Ku protein [Pseudomonadota bacterium]|nr:Ku protein [Pseudomonadota bacterium]